MTQDLLYSLGACHDLTGLSHATRVWRDCLDRPSNWPVYGGASIPRGNTAEQIAEELESLGLALVYKTLAFYLENQEEVDVYVDAYTAELERQHAAYTPGPGILRLKRLKKLVEDADERYGSDPAWSSLSIIEKLQRLGALPLTNPV
jgi:hypothetical protein